MNDSLNGKVALITGASTGIGLASAHELAARWARLFITGRRHAEIADAARAIGRGTVGVQADVSNLADLDRLFERISDDAGRLDIRERRRRRCCHSRPSPRNTSTASLEPT